MKKCFFSFAIALIALFSNSVYCQVGIGTMKPDSSATLDVVSDTITPLGVLVPRMSETARDRIKNPADGLVIYNNDEDCFNYYSLSDTTWQSLCGKLGKATIDSAYCSQIHVYGSYIQGVATTVNERIVIPVEVLKPGSYDMTVVAMLDPATNNGYTFMASGVFLYAGKQTVTLTAQGTPQNVDFNPNDPTVGDHIKMNLNGTELDACNNVVIQVIPAAADYDVSCGSAVVNGIYTMAPDKTNSDDATHYIDVSVNVNDLGTGVITSGWSAETNKVSGVQFRGSGIFNNLGSNTVRLYAVAGTKPTTLDPIVLTMTFQTKNGEVDCQVTLRAAYTPKKIAIFGTQDVTYGYALNPNGSAYKLLSSLYNFGNMNESTVKMVVPNTAEPGGYSINGAFNVKWYSTGTNSQTNWNNIMSEKPDIVIITYAAATISTTGAGYVMNYLNTGGIVLQFTENNPRNMIASVFGLPATNIGAARYGTGSWTQLANYQDPILNGPFQPIINGTQTKTLGGLYLCGDTETQLYGVTGLPASGIIIYGYNNATTAPGAGSVSAFRATGQRYCYFGEGGFFTKRDNGNNPTSTTIEPFVTSHDLDSSDNTYRPALHDATSGNFQYGDCNSFYFANMLAWAIDQAQFYGINTK